MVVRSRKVRARTLMEVCKFFANPNFRSKRCKRSTQPEADDPQPSSLEPNLTDPTEHTEPGDLQGDLVQQGDLVLQGDLVQQGDLVRPDIQGTPSETDNLKVIGIHFFSRNFKSSFDVDMQEEKDF